MHVYSSKAAYVYYNLSVNRSLPTIAVTLPHAKRLSRCKKNFHHKQLAFFPQASKSTGLACSQLAPIETCESTTILYSTTITPLRARKRERAINYEDDIYNMAKDGEDEKNGHNDGGEGEEGGRGTAVASGASAAASSGGTSSSSRKGQQQTNKKKRKQSSSGTKGGTGKQKSGSGGGGGGGPSDGGSNKSGNDQDGDDGDEKKRKRVMANRRSARESRNRRVKLLSDLKETVGKLAGENVDLAKSNLELRDELTSSLRGAGLPATLPDTLVSGQALRSIASGAVDVPDGWLLQNAASRRDGRASTTNDRAGGGGGAADGGGESETTKRPRI